MSKSLFQAYTDYVININKMIYDTHMEITRTTQEFATNVTKLNPYKDVFGIMDSFVDGTTARKSK